MNEEFTTLISVLGGLVLLLCPLAYAIYILGRLDIAAKKRKLSGVETCLLYTSPSPRDATLSRMPSSA